MNNNTTTLNLNNCTPAQIATIARDVVAADERRQAKWVRGLDSQHRSVPR